MEFEGNVPIPKSYVTLGEVMQKAGYATGAFGKWGQGYPGSVGDPVLRGFDQFYGYNCQREAHNYYPGHLWKNDKKVVLTGNEKGKKEQYSHDLITEQALSFIATPRDKPFFAYVPYTIPHTSFQVPDLEPYREKSWSGNQKTQAAMISRMDRDVGRIVKQVEALGKLENTLIIFSSDNGPHGAGKTLTHFNAAGPLRGKKGATYEGGIRVPLVVSWPGKIKPGTESDLISGFQDLFPTFAELAGAKAPANIDGISFVSELLGRPTQKKHEYLYWELGTRQGLRKGNWKAIRNSTKKKLGDVEIYDLSNDIGESNNLATQKPEIAAQFLELLQSARKPSELFPIPVLDNEK
ncbi:MAG: sulfatase-like hydrolase/transferase [Planctomycetaceae bacterium]|nr:sulfatase-like hydrolase/transferase [Planctomycetaceae bacterium]